jgi:hypothetical protein
MPERAQAVLDKSRMRQRGRELRALLNEWDPIGVVADGGPTDEYDCLLWPLMRLLEQDATPRDIASFLKGELKGHFGLGPFVRRPMAFAERAKAWFDHGWADTKSR